MPNGPMSERLPPIQMLYHHFPTMKKAMGGMMCGMMCGILGWYPPVIKHSTEKYTIYRLFSCGFYI